MLGTPIATDRLTASRERLSFARVLVEMEIVESLPNEIPIMTPKGVLQQPVLFEWKPLKCKKCGRIGHAMDTCVAPVRRVWQVKNVPPVVSVPKATGSVVDRGKAVLDESRAAKEVSASVMHVESEKLARDELLQNVVCQTNVQTLDGKVEMQNAGGG